MSTAFLSRSLAQLGTYENVEYELRDAHGNLKPIFQEYRFTQYLMKKGIISPLWINSWYASLVAPFLGYWSGSKRFRNLVTNAGFALAAGRLNGSGSPAAATYIAVGTGTTAANASDTTLETEITDSGLARVNGTVSLVTTTVTNDTAQVTTTFTVSGTKAVTESGVLNASSSGTLLCRQVFSAINVVNGDSLAITWKVKMS
jgi:hypothetical protein